MEVHVHKAEGGVNEGLKYKEIQSGGCKAREEEGTGGEHPTRPLADVDRPLHGQKQALAEFWKLCLKKFINVYRALSALKKKLRCMIL